MIQRPLLKNKIRILIAIVATVVLLALFFRHSDPARITALLRSTNLGWFVVGMLANIGALICRTERWRTILRPQAPPPFYATFFSTSLGFMTSAILPIRAADVIRPALLSRRTDIRFSAALGTVLCERILDLLSILLLFVLFVFTSGQRFANNPATRGKFAAIETAGYVAGGVILAALLFLVGVYFWSGGIRRVHAFLTRALPHRFRDSSMHFYDSFVESLSIIHDGAAFARIVILTAGVWLFLSSQFFFVALATHHPLPFPVSFFLTGITIIGLMIPTPGGVGGFHKACQIALVGFYGFDIDSSIAVAVIFHLVGTLPILMVGAILLWRERLGLSQLLRVRDQVQAEAES